jgi:periplasmic protein TonB
VLNLRRFFIYSFVVHVFIFVAILLLIPPAEEKRGKGEIFTQLVSPDELLSGKPVIRPPLRRQSAPLLSRPRPQMSRPHSSFNQLSPNTSTQKEPPLLSAPVQTGTPGQKMEEKLAMRGSGQRQEKSGPAMKEKLFDRGIIGDIAKRNIEKEEREKKDTSFTFDTKEYKFLIYNQRLKQRIESIWVYPRDAAAQGIYGDLVIKFTIMQNGNLGSVELVRTSGHKSLDDAAIKALRDGAPYWPIPKEWGMEAYTIEGLFVYTLYGYYVM